MSDHLLLSPGDVERMLATRVRTARTRRGWTQHQLAVRSGLGIATVARLERSGRGQLTSLVRIAAALGHLADFEHVLALEGPTSLQELRERRDRR